ncbi:YqgQ family protein [Thermoactinomyces mirandus]|uniref:YqgQ family protein n=1 Tax=Thermoactinomyces mirandus TaxID=2756294 RepID=A0A7W1XQP7_9BACL|nr:YqgQ family protein [Thermoactinomyces mirandus]MBA4601498.1 YqgQ family protein [Thermoactinomyces mirandus]
MQTMADVRRLLKRFGTIIYTGDRQGDIELMLDEVKELRQYGMIDKETYQKAMAVLLQQSSRFKTMEH